MWGDWLNLGNGQTYTGSNPWSWVDPFGLYGFWDLVQAAVLTGGECKAPVDTWGSTSGGNQVVGAVEQASPLLNNAADTGMLIASTAIPGPEDGVIAVAGSVRLSTKISKLVGKLFRRGDELRVDSGGLVHNIVEDKGAGDLLKGQLHQRDIAPSIPRA